MVPPVLESLVERLPYLDGSGRRRFVAGGIIVITSLFILTQNIQVDLKDVELEWKQILFSPILVGGILLIIYAVGNLAEMLGELFFVRVAKRLLLVVFWVPSAVLHKWFGIRRPLVLSDYLSQKGNVLFDDFPDRIKIGLTELTGIHSDVALRYIIGKINNQSARKWAEKLINRTKDVMATTTAIFFLLAYFLITPFFVQDQSKKPLIGQYQTAEEMFLETLDRVGGTMDGEIGDALTRLVDEAKKDIDRQQSSKGLSLEGSSKIEDNYYSFLHPLRSGYRDLYDIYRELSYTARNSGIDRPSGKSDLSKDTFNEVKGPAYSFSVLTEMKEAIGKLQSLPGKVSLGTLKGLNLDMTPLKKADERLRKLLYELNDQIEKLMVKYDEVTKFDERERIKKEIKFLKVIGITFLLLLLYSGFFLSLRNAIVNILDELSLEQAGGVNSTVSDHN